MSNNLLFLMAALGVATVAHALQPVAVTQGMQRSPIHSESIHICECCEANPPLQCVKYFKYRPRGKGPRLAKGP